MFAVTQVALLVVVELGMVVGLAMAAVRWQRHQRQTRAEIDQHRDVTADDEATIKYTNSERLTEVIHDTSRHD
jgi:uncharacterized membrane protein YidH (DUF202 family)